MGPWSFSPPTLVANMLQGSKAIGHKCKVFKFLLLGKLDPAKTLLENYTNVLTAVTQVRKAVASGKQGEAGLKVHTDGSLICPVDTINENLKLLEDSLQATNLKSHVGIGISWQADLLYNPDQKKYELENPKQLLDENQLIDFIVKLANDRPVINYIEDPLIVGEVVDGWIKLKEKLNSMNVSVGTRKVATIKKMIEKGLILDTLCLRSGEFGTLSELVDFIRFVSDKSPKTQLLVSDPHIDNINNSTIDLTLALPHGGYILSPHVNKTERLIKINRISEFV
eukprot:TRINITY_DN8418_c0_g1_i2.p1 TRINITY_DN8418_c0_g1~~TRINITY_DN8418_c0_g1_i2.p1  ORF type:complete len:282 (+),score=69.88 TRINITY_DN8418_c0_g1_i2:647-1492(+)